MTKAARDFAEAASNDPRQAGQIRARLTEILRQSNRPDTAAARPPKDERERELTARGKVANCSFSDQFTNSKGSTKRAIPRVSRRTLPDADHRFANGSAACHRRRREDYPPRPRPHHECPLGPRAPVSDTGPSRPSGQDRAQPWTLRPARRPGDTDVLSPRAARLGALRIAAGARSTSQPSGSPCTAAKAHWIARTRSPATSCASCASWRARRRPEPAFCL